MHPIPFLTDLVVILGAAVVVLLVSRQLRVPTVVGFLLTGLLIGPSGLALMENKTEVEVFAEIGVVILLFTIGLEFSLERLRQIQRSFFLGGSLQAFATIAVVTSIGMALDLTIPESLFAGFLVTLSSTAIVLRLYIQRREIDAPQGKLVLGILLFQDFIIVLMIVLTPVLAGTVEASVTTLAVRFLNGLLVIGAAVVAARFLMPRVLHQIARLQVREVFVLGALVFCLGLALLTARFEFSLALGAFLAGIIISESEYSHQVVAEVIPFRDVFNSIFFISVGMLLDLGYVAENPVPVLAVGVSIFLIKLLVVLLIVLLMGFPTRIATIVSISLAQIGEFSFVLLKVGEGHGLLAEDIYQTFLAASILTMAVTPLLVNAAPGLAEQAQKRVPWRLRTSRQPVPEEVQGLAHHVIVVGYGINGANLSRVLKATSVTYVVIDISVESVKLARQAGVPVLYGDATREDILRMAGIEEARIIVLAISDPLATRAGVKLARRLNPKIQIVVRSRSVEEIDELYRVGADEVIPEEFETSIELFTRVLEHYRLPRNVITAQEKLIRGERYRILRTPTTSVQLSDRMMHWLSAGTTEVYLVQEGSRAVEATLRQLDLRHHTGVTVLAVVRGEEPRANPDPGFQICAGDSLVLVGSHAEIERAVDYLDRRGDPDT